MRNDRQAQSAFHAEVINRNTKQQFVSDYYPINFIASDRYVFFNTLYRKTGTGKNLASKAATWLYGPMRNPTRNFRGKTNAKYAEALEFLRSAAEVEYARETAFLDRYAESNPAIKKIIDKCNNAGADKYLNLINALNMTLKGQERYETELNKEIERIKNRQEIMDRDKKAAKEGRYVAVKKGENKEKLTSKEYAIRRELNGDPTMGDTVLNPYYNFNGQKIFNAMFKKNSDFSIIAENIMLKYGSHILDTKSGVLKLNKSQALAMVKVLIQEAYNTLSIEFSDTMKKVKGENRSARRERLEKALEEMTSAGGRVDELFNNIVNSPDPYTALDSIAKQYQIELNPSKLQDLGHSTKTLNQRVKKMYEAEKAAGKTKLSYAKWRQQKNLTEKDMREFVYMMANVKAQAYYTNEGMAVADIIGKKGIAALGGGANAPTDVNAGFLICTFTYEDQPPEVQERAKELISGDEMALSKAQAEALDKQQKITNKESYISNIGALEEMQEKQLEILTQLKADLESLGINAENMINHINIHETIKGYASINATTDKFEGAAFGARLTDQVEIINQMLIDANISPLEADWLIFAMINCGEGMIGSDNKHALEDYLSGYVGLLMFSDASIIAKDVSDYMNNMVVSDITNIHLYVLNNKYVPSSYILNETYKAMEQFLEGIESQTNGTVLSLTTYSSPNAYLVYPKASWSLEDLSGPAWKAEGQEALEATHLTMYFVSNFLGLLQQLQNQLPIN